MTARFQWLAAATGLFLSGLTGCGQLRCGCGDSGCHGSPYAFQKYDVCCETCGPSWGPSRGACRCGRPSCGVDCGRKVQCRCALVDAFQCAGCGELYWSEWFNDPPACCDPCDCHGRYTGPGDTGHYQAPYLAHSAPGHAAPTPLPPLEVAPAEPQAAPPAPPEAGKPLAPMPEPPAGAPPEPLPDRME
jgi:hypothetical protein